MTREDPMVPAREMQIALPAGAFAARPRRFSASVLLVGDGFARSFLRRFGTHSDDAIDYACDSDLPDDAAQHPPTAVLPVEEAARESVGWRVWTNALGICAKAGVGESGATMLALPEGARVTMAIPAVETTAHELVLFALRAEGGETRIFECRFPPPATADRKKRAPGAPSATLVGTLPGTLAGACALGVVPGSAEARLVCPFTTPDGLSLVHVVARDGRVEATASVGIVGAKTIPGVVPSAYVNDDGDTVVAMLVARPGDRSDDVDLVVSSARVRGSHLLDVEHRRWGRLAREPKSGAVAFSSIATERPDYRFAVLMEDEALYVGASDGALARMTIDGSPLAPLSWSATRDAAHVAVRAESGPLLARARPTALVRAASSVPERGWLWTFPPLADDLLASPRTGIFLSGPEVVERTPGWRLPLVVSQRGLADDLDRLALEERGFLVFLEHGSTAARVAPLMPAGCAPRLPLRLLGEEPDPKRLEPAARVAHVDATHRLTFPTTPTEGTLFVVVADQRSDGQRLTLGEAPAAVPGEEPRVAGPEVVLQQAPELTEVDDPLRAPPAGITLAVERYAVRRAGSKLVLRGAFRLPVDALTGAERGAHVTVVATGAASPVPRALVLRVDTRTYASHLVGDFAIDLFSTTLCDAPDTWFIHGFVGGHAGGPAVTTVVPEAD